MNLSTFIHLMEAHPHLRMPLVGDIGCRISGCRWSERAGAAPANAIVRRQRMPHQRMPLVGDSGCHWPDTADATPADAVGRRQRMPHQRIPMVGHSGFNPTSHSHMNDSWTIFGDCREILITQKLFQLNSWIYNGLKFGNVSWKSIEMGRI